jgi:gliding motility-associated-like protein
MLCAGFPVTFSASATGGGATPSYQWKLNGLNAGVDSTGFTNLAPADGDLVECVLTSDAPCAQPAIRTSDPVHIRVTPEIPLAVSISMAGIGICTGEPAHFSAIPVAAASTLDFQWQVNGRNAGADSTGFTILHPANGDLVRCILTSPSSCLTATSTPIAVSVNAVPSVQSGQTVSLLRGESVVFDPAITGDIATYAWSPPTGLSDPTIRDPRATPGHSTVYTLRVVATDGCAADGTFAVKVTSPIRIPDAFTPNGDGRNDVFYLLGGLDGSVIRDLAVYSRSGQRVFHVHDVPPGDPAYGWNGLIGGAKAGTGNYVYIAVIVLSDGSKEVYKGSILLIR